MRMIDEERETVSEESGTSAEAGTGSALTEDRTAELTRAAKRRKRAERRAARRKAFVNKIWRIWNPFRRALFPDDITCDICGAELKSDKKYRICSECAAKLPTTKGHRCYCCGMPLAGEGQYCMRCTDYEMIFRINRSPLVYSDAAKDLIYRLKYKGQKYLARTLAEMMVDEYRAEELSAEIIVFVPMTAAEERKRGFNQSELLARIVGEELGLPVLPALVKNRETPPQKTLSGRERRKNLVGVFACIFKEIKGRAILLIDDVFTTGATTNECAKVLFEAGADSVEVLTAAITVLKQPVEETDPEESQKP